MADGDGTVVEGDVKQGDVVDVVAPGQPADATVVGDVKPGDVVDVTGDAQPMALTGDGAAVETEEYQHPEPRPFGFVHQDNVTEPGVQITHKLTEDGPVEQRHETEPSGEAVDDENHDAIEVTSTETAPAAQPVQ